MTTSLASLPSSLPNALRPARHRVSPARQAASLRRTYFRRRLVVALLAIGAPVGLLAGTHQAGASRDASPPVEYVVQPGDTLWSIAERLHGDRSVSSYVDVLVASNGGTALTIGQVLVLPG